jgi:hypothetical protein
MLQQGQEAMLHWDHDAAVLVSDDTQHAAVAEGTG